MQSLADDCRPEDSLCLQYVSSDNAFSERRMDIDDWPLFAFPQRIPDYNGFSLVIASDVVMGGRIQSDLHPS